MEGQSVRDQATALCEALVAGDMDRAIEHFSKELRQHFGDVVGLLPLPCTEATVVSIEHSGAGDNVVLRLVGETDEVEIQTRWKERDDRPTIIEASHLSQRAREIAEGEDVDGGAAEAPNDVSLDA
jgi:hypothetical protein